MIPRSKTARGILVELDMGRNEMEGEKRDERRKSIEDTVRSASAAWALGYTRKRSVVLGLAIRRGWLGEERNCRLL